MNVPASNPSAGPSVLHRTARLAAAGLVCWVTLAAQVARSQPIYEAVPAVQPVPLDLDSLREKLNRLQKIAEQNPNPVSQSLLRRAESSFDSRLPEEHRLRMAERYVVRLEQHLRAQLGEGAFEEFDRQGRTLDAAKAERQLAENKIEPTQAGLKKYLELLAPRPDQDQVVAKLIEQLGHEEFALREQASTELAQLPSLPRAALEAAMKSRDPEIQWRAGKLLGEAGRSGTGGQLHAALIVIGERKMTGLAPQVINILPQCTERELALAATKALKNTSRPEEADLLRQSLKSPQPFVRAAATAALGQALQDKAADDLARMLSDAEPSVQMAAARGLADLGDRRALAALHKLLSAPRMSDRVASAVILSELTGQSVDFVGGSDADQAEMLVRWKKWLETEGRTAPLVFPVKSAGLSTDWLDDPKLIEGFRLDRVGCRDGRLYAVIARAGGMDWMTADMICRRLGGRLVSIADAEEDTFVRSLQSSCPHAWIGLNDRGEEGTWRWTSGEPVTFTRWRDSEPNNTGDEDGVVTETSGWSDVPLHKRVPGCILERDR